MPNTVALWLKDVFGSAGFASGMIGTLVGGGITIAVQRFSIAETRRQREEDRKRTQVARASALVYKLMRIANGVYRGIETFEERFRFAAENNLDQKHPWTFCQKIANPGVKIYFEAEELSLFLQLGETSAFNKVCYLDNMHNTFLDLLCAYNDKRQKLESMLKPLAFDLSTGRAAGEISETEYVRLQPHFFECDALINQILAWKPNVDRAKEATDLLIEIMARSLDITLKLSWENQSSSASTKTAA